MIIVEGPDGAGKTTLVKRLEAELGITKEPRAVTSGSDLLEPIGHYIERELSRGFSMRLYDRFALISSPMYVTLPNRTFRDELLDFGWLQMQNYKMEKLDPVIIFCLPPLEEVKKNMARNDNSDGIVFPHIEEIYWSYHAYAARHYRSSQMIWDYTNSNEQRLANLLSWAKARIERDNGRQTSRYARYAEEASVSDASTEPGTS